MGSTGRPEGEALKVAVTGASGFIGSALAASLASDGHDVVRLVRDRQRSTGDAAAVFWDPREGALDPGELEGIDVLVHLAGAGVGDRRWTPDRKKEILESRTLGTRLVAETLASLSRPPEVLVSGSAVGFYGNGGDTVLTEESERGSGFLAELVEAWEGAAKPATEAGIRVVHPRTGVVLGRDGGLLKQLLLPFRLGLGGRLGPGTQWVSWISLHDEVRALRFLSGIPTDGERPDDGVLPSGPVNLVAPNPVTYGDLAKALGRAVRRPSFMPTPVAPLRLIYGSQLVEEVMLVSQRAEPSVLASAGFEFSHRDIDDALHSELRP